MADIKRLLNKKGWTGRELGILEITNVAKQFEQTLKGEEPKPLIDPAQFQKMVNEIKDPVQGREYNNYIALHEWLVVEYNIAQTQTQQAQVQFRTLEGYITRATIAEDVFRYVSKLPYIVTQKQYDRMKAERIEAYFKEEDGEERFDNIFPLIYKGIGYYLERLHKEPRKPNPLKAIRKKYQTLPVKSKLILDRWNEVTERGYYVLPDGRRSDQMTDEEWQDAIFNKTLREAFAKRQLKLGTIEIDSTLAVERLTHKAKVIFNGGTEEEADREQTKWEQERGLSTPMEWHNYEDPPTDLTKWDVIEEDVLHELYPASLDGDDPYTDKNFTASMKDFYNEFKELVDFILKDMDTRYFKGDEVQASKLKLDEWATTTIAWRRLYELDFYGAKAEAESDVNVFNGNRRALFNGVAILRPSDIMSKCKWIDDNGDYIHPELGCSLDKASLEAFFTEAEDYATNVDILTDARETLLDSYFFIKGFNYAIGRIAVLYDVPDLNVFQIPIGALETRIEAFNELVPILYQQIKDTDYSDKELQAKKMKVLQDYFQPVEYKSLDLTDEAKQEMEDLLQNFQAFKPNSTRFHELIRNRPKGEGA